MLSFLSLGFLLGMAHALEADHIAAVGTLASDGRATPKRLAFLGASWGMGHTTTLFLLSLPVVAFGYALSARAYAGLEVAVGVMLVGLGAHVLWKLWRKRIHFHVHDHGEGPHLHAHSHAASTLPHARDPHDHAHFSFSPRAFAVGLAHGAAGSAGLVALAAAASGSAAVAMLYVAIFGIGSVLGMAFLTWAASWPLGLAEASAGRVLTVLQLAVAGLAIYIGMTHMAEFAPALAGAAEAADPAGAAAGAG